MAHSWRVRRVGAHSKPRRARARLTVSVERPPRVRRWPCHGSFQRIHTTATQVNQPPPPPPPFDTATTTAHLYAVYPTRPPISKRGEAFLKVSAGLAAGAGSGSRSARAATRRTLSNVHEHTHHQLLHLPTMPRSHQPQAMRHGAQRRIGVCPQCVGGGAGRAGNCRHHLPIELCVHEL